MLRNQRNAFERSSPEQRIVQRCQGPTLPLCQCPESVIRSRNVVILNVVKDLLFNHLRLYWIPGNLLRTSAQFA